MTELSTPDSQHLWRLARKPGKGGPTDGDFNWTEESIPDPGANQLCSRTIYLSMDPYQWVRRRTGTEQPGDVCHGRTVSQVVKSNHSDYDEGDYLFNTNGWSEFGLTGDGIDYFNYMLPRKLDATAAPLSTAIGVLGMLGLTAYAGSVVQCDPQPGETFVVSAASGGVGQVAGQLARIRGCRVVGIAGVDEKCQYVVNELGFDACVSHLSETLGDDLKCACPDGIDVYFENVGGKVFDAVAPLLNTKSRVSVCGLISQYGLADPGISRQSWNETGQSHFDRHDVTVHDLFVGNFVKDYQAKFLEEASSWYRDGKLKYREDFWDGLERAPKALNAMLTGHNFGKMIVRVSEVP